MTFSLYRHRLPTLRSAAVLIGLFTCAVVDGAIYDATKTEGSLTRTLRLNIPDTVETVCGIIIVGNGAGGSTLSQAEDPELVALASRIQFAVMGTTRWTGFWYTDNSEILLFESMLSDFAATTGHVELVNAPWLPMGHSNGGQMSYGMAAKRPEKVIAFITSKGAYYNDPYPSESTLRIPGLLIAGEIDTELRRTNIALLYSTNRARGALWSWVEEEATTHADHNGQQLKLPFLVECCRLRYPDDQSPLDGPVTLKDLNAFDGWLVDQTTWDTGMTEIFPYENAPRDPINYGWVPNKRIAMLYRAFSSRNKVTQDITVITSPRSLSDSTVFALPVVSGLEWDSIEGFVDGCSLGTVQTGEIPSWPINFQTGGLYTFHALITLSDGSQRVSYLNRVFVDAQLPQTKFENWLFDQYPPGLQFPETRSEDGLTTALQRFAYDLDSDGGHLPRIEIAATGSGMAYSYTQNAQCEESGIEFHLQVSEDLSRWIDMAEDDPLVNIDGNTVSMTLEVVDGAPRWARTGLYLRP